MAKLIHRIINIIVTILTVAGVTMSCAPEEFLNVESPDIVQFEGEQTIMVGQEGGVFSIAISSSGSPTVSMLGNTVSWITWQTAADEEGKTALTVTVAENTEIYERNASLKISNGEMTQYVVFRQKQKGSITLSSSVIEMPIEGGEFSVDVTANCEIEYEPSADWIRFLGKNNHSAELSTLRFQVEPYYEYNKREGYVTIKGDGVTEKVTVYQTFAEDFVLYCSDTYWVSADRQTISIDVRSNIDFSVRMPEVDWITSVNTKSSSTHTCRFEISQNESIDDRFADIVFVSELGTENKVTVEQKGKQGFLLGATEYFADSAGETFDINVKTNVNISVSSYYDWISAELTSSKDAIRISVSPNEMNQYREGLVYVSYYGLPTETIRIVQQGKNLAYLASETGITYCNAGEHTVNFIRNVNYTCTVSADAASWISIPEGQANGISDSMTLKVSDWNGEEDRTGTVQFEYSDGKSDTYILTQVSPGKISLSYDLYSLCHTDYTQTIYLHALSDMDIFAEVPEDCTWITTTSPWSRQRSASMETKNTCIYVLPVENKRETLSATVTLWTADRTASQKVRIKMTPVVALNDATSMEEIKNVLMKFYEATGGDNWNNNEGWGTDRPLDEWYGISYSTTTNSEDNITKITSMTLQFSGNNLTGVIPSELFSIPVLTTLNIFDENITAIEDGISQAASLSSIQISDHNGKLTRIPSDLFESKTLTSIKVCCDQHVAVPDIKKDNDVLRTLELWPAGYNIPNGIGYLTGLTDLRVWGRSYLDEGEAVPFPEINKLPDLRYFYISGCNLSGEIPSEIGNLTKLEYFDLTACNVSGEIPAEFGNIEKLKWLNLSSNNLTGSIPDALSSLKNLERLNVSGNELTGEIPSWVSNIEAFECYGNRMSIGHSKMEAKEMLSPEIYAAWTNQSRMWSLYPQRLTPEEDAMQREVLADIYESFNGDNWKDRTNWLNHEVPVENWYGVDVNGNYGVVVRIDLSENNSKGTYPESIVDFDAFVYDLQHNNDEWYFMRDFNIYIDELTASPSDRVLHCGFYQSQWLNTFGSNVSAYINSDKLPVGISKFNITDIDGKSYNSDELFSKYKHIIVSQIPRSGGMFISNYADLQEIHHSMNGEVGIIIAGDSEKFLKGLQKRFGDDFFYFMNEDISAIGGMNSNFDNHSWEATEYYTSYSPIYQNFTEYDILDYLTLIDCERTMAIWHGFSWAGCNPSNGTYDKRFGGTQKLKDYMADIYGVEISETISSDFSVDGNVKTLQTASKGNGINVVIMGEGFVDAQHASGLYDEVMNEAYEALFMTEPYKSFKDRFNVYSVAIVSSNMYGNTALELSYGEGTHIDGSESKTFEYALKAPTVNEDNIHNTLCMVIANNPRHAGTCTMFEDNSAVAYSSMSNFIHDSYAGTIQHESGGHGFAKLGDEYWYNDNRSAPSNAFATKHSLGWYSNLDTESDPDKVLWAKFLDREEYLSTTGVFEGGSEYGKKAYRPSEDSMMKSSTISGQGSVYNAPSREAIYKRIMELSGEDYSFEKFLEYDKINLQGNTASAVRAQRSSAVGGQVKDGKHSGPIFVKGTWRDAK